MLLLQLLLNGLSPLFTAMSSVALLVKLVVQKQRELGSIADRQCLQKTIVGSGKNFTSVVVGGLGGPGVAIAQRQS